MPKKTIPPILREKVWLNFFKTIEGYCYCCNNPISIRSFHCGHIIAEHNGGLTCLENLVPICKSCNSSMGTTNLYAYKEKFYSSNDEPGTFGQQFIHNLIHDIYQTSNTTLNNIDKLKMMKELISNSIDEKIKELIG